jgi:organic radical activating enzyme
MEGFNMNIFDKFLSKIFPPKEPLPPGLYPYQTPPGAEVPYRMHLRIDSGGKGMLIVNASTVLHLNETATEFAYHLIKLTPEDVIARSVSKRYDVSQQQALHDFAGLKEQIEVLISTEDLDPITYLGFDRQEPYSGESSAPYRLDCAVTYQVADEGADEFVPEDRVHRELSTEEWQTIIRKTWDAGIPHIIFTGGEPTMRPDLPDLLALSEELGQVTGLLTNGLRLSESQYLDQLLIAGLDHVMMIFDHDEEQAWEALRDCLAENLYITVHLTLKDTQNPQEELQEMTTLLDKFLEMGVHSISLSASATALQESLEDLRQAVADRDLTLAWDLPVPYSRFNPVALELENADQIIDGSGRGWMYVEPDGDVLRSQGLTDVLGNLLTDEWEQIYQKLA